MTHCKHYFEILFYVTFAFIKEKNHNNKKKKYIKIYKERHKKLRWLVNSKMDAYKLFFRKSNTKSHIILFKKYAIPLKAPESSLKIYKNNFFTSCTQKTALATAISTNMKYFKKHISEKRKLKHTCLKCLFVASLTEPLSFCVWLL